MAAALPFLQIAGTALAAVAALSQASAASRAADYNAAAAERNAALSRDQAAADADAQGRFARKKIGAARAAYGASGVTPEGSPLDVLASSAASAELDRQSLIYKGELRAMGYQDTAALERSASDSAASRGGMNAASEILTGTIRYQANKPKAQSGYTLGEYGSPIDM